MIKLNRFGPIGVGALWYVALAADIFPEKQSTFLPIAYFIVFVSVVAHGITVPIVHLALGGAKPSRRVFASPSENAKPEETINLRVKIENSESLE